MMHFLSLLGQWKMTLLFIGASLFLAYALSDLSGVISEDVTLRKQSIDSEKATAEKTKKIMEYDPAKARLVAP